MKISLAELETILLYNQAEPMAEVYTQMCIRDRVRGGGGDQRLSGAGGLS